jgi:ATP-dependent protease HslVU (ClpYQ) peptidase subunit
MTVVVGFKDSKGKVWMGSDLSTLYGFNRLEQIIPKYISLGNQVVIGSCGLAMFQQYLVKLAADLTPSQIDKQFDFTHLRGIIHLAEKMRDDLEEEGYTVVEGTGDPKVVEGAFVVATPDTLYLISPDFAVAEVKDFVAIGSGAEFAYGAHFALQNTKPKTELHSCDVLHTAIAAANKYNAGCSGFSEFICVSDLKPLEDKHASGNPRKTGRGKG